MKTRILVIDDSALVRRLLCEALARMPDVEVVGTAQDPYVARERIVELEPDVLTLDIEMPRMDGLSFLDKLMQHHPLPVVVISSLTPRGSEMAMRAYELGATEVLCKPTSSYDVADLGPALGRAVQAAAASRPRKRSPASPTRSPLSPLKLERTTMKVLAIGASTGGTEAIRAVVERLPADTPGTIIVQHMPPLFTASFAKRLDGLGAMRVAEAAGGEVLNPGFAYVAPGGHHLVVQRSGATYILVVRDGPPVHFQRPAVDVTFLSVANAAGANAVGVILTGMGTDGASGLAAMRKAGAHTIGQDEASCVVYGMPKAAFDAGAVAEVLPLDSIADGIVRSFAKAR